MDIYSIGSRKRETYRIELKSSLLWEAALGIAAITNESLVETLDFSKEELNGISTSFSRKLNDQLTYVKENNTWKTLLQLLHQEDFQDLASFASYVRDLSEEELKGAAIPYLGKNLNPAVSQLLQGSREALEMLQDETRENSFIPAYLEFIFTVEAEELKHHLITVLRGWYDSVIKPREGTLEAILRRDMEAKRNMSEKMEPEHFVEWATDGIKYRPEPSVFTVLLIPHYFYRPWNVEADLEGTKVIYYPVANESLSPDSQYVPDKMLVQRYKALGDANRLKILKLISEKERTLQELTEIMGMGKTTVHHHLKLLKSARLVSDSASKYYINEQILHSAGEELKNFLKK
ncbi:winged helix-turn-helix transcriptional regulator [Rossellomorea vietnamensis]|uniref:Winged helix-turn-helix transcriptional regulator n=1 Tax=Rossellomorea vietnamensis TaxID=218284 RepID=A0A5D4MFL9_9BACI|nr:metalloregulator ArsR/SmtB family transcription factor [Rossellomorea vietnamensis]TYS00665.1 winged helix-turn-helix transcriptional regulator [Rossellomorea vietnamensis]